MKRDQVIDLVRAIEGYPNLAFDRAQRSARGSSDPSNGHGISSARPPPRPLQLRHRGASQHIHALTMWRAYIGRAAVDGRIKDLAQLSVVRTAVDHLNGNALLWALGPVTYQLLHTIRSQALFGSWRRAPPDRLRA